MIPLCTSKNNNGAPYTKLKICVEENRIASTRANLNAENTKISTTPQIVNALPANDGNPRE